MAVSGISGLGHFAVQYAKKAGYKVVAISRGVDKEKLAKELGTHDYIDGDKKSCRSFAITGKDKSNSCNCP